MGVYIKGMDMPRNCELCNFRHYTLDTHGWMIWCKQTGEIVCRVGKSQGRPEWCPLVEVRTPHGKLIDADEMAEIYHAGSFNVIKVAKAMRTVIEAEKKDERVN